MADLPTGTVTLLFTDIEGSTRLLDELGERHAEVLAEHRRLLREKFEECGGVEVDTQGDAFFYAFPKARDAVEAARKAQLALADGLVRVRMGVHTGEPIVTEEGYVGIDVHRAARIMGAGHGGQVVISEHTRALVDGAQLSDLGLHRLKDLGEPEKLFQLGDADFPPLRTLDATNLPLAASPLLGRERELDELLALLANGTRLLTVTGPGGTGKTRLALQVAAELVGSLKDGVFWVPLAGLTDAELVLPTIAQMLGARDELQEHLRGKELLLLLDNLEHLLSAAPALGGLLAGSEGLRLLVTSRAPLRLSGEREYALEPLPPSDAVTLFCERARAVGRELVPDETVEAICRRLDGLPLALELAASRTKLLAPETLLQRLEHVLPLLTRGARDAPERQRTLRATIEWSYDLLEEQAKRLFVRLAVFAGSFSLEAAEEICQAELDSLASLVDQSLLKPIGESRFLILETIGEYAGDRLDESGELDELRGRHAEYFLGLAEDGDLAVREGRDQAAWLQRFEPEHDNLRAALDWLARAAEPELELRLATALGNLWEVQGHYFEAQRCLEAALDRGPKAPTLLRARALHLAGTLAYDRGDYDRANAWLEGSLGIARRLGDVSRAARSLANLGLVATGEGELDRATSLYEEALALFRELGEERAIGVTIGDLGYIELLRGEYARAEDFFEEAVALLRGANDDVSLVMMVLNLALVALQRGERRRATELGGEGLELAGRLVYREGIWSCLEALAAAEEQAAQAARLLGAAAALREADGGSLQPFERGLHERTVAAVRRELGAEAFAKAWASGADRGLEETVASAVDR